MQPSEVSVLSRGALVGVLLRALGKRFRGIRLTEDGLVLLAREPREVPFSEMAGPPQMERAFGFSGISVPLTNGSVLKVVGLKRKDAEPFVEIVKQTWSRSISRLFDAANEELHALSAVIERLKRPRRYPSACLLHPFAKRADTLVARLPKTYPEDFISVVQRQMLNAVSGFQKAPEQMRDTAIETFIEAELSETKSFFDTIETHPLTPEQRRAVVTDEDATLVLAGAGSGKTSVIVAKAAYLIQRGIRKPEEILLMAFGRDAAEEMATRIKERCGSPVDARTFHALGNEIIRKVEGQAPALAPHASDEAQFLALLRDILTNEIATQEGPRAVLLSWFTEFYRPYKSEWDFKTKNEYDRYVEDHELRTLQGEVVRSFEELEIANWLYRNGIAYEYEPIYEHALPENDRRVYTPDFRLTESGVYIEHFGVRKERGPDGATRFTTAPYVDRERYLEGMAWKRKIHEDHGTTLIETYSYERVEGRLTEALRKKLEPYATPNPIPSQQVFDTLVSMGQIDAFTQTLGTFLRHFKSCALTVERCRQRAEKSTYTLRSLAFLKIFEPLLESYESRLGERIDFEDMISRATDHVRAGRYRSPYRHLLVDEFQDISNGRAQLLLALKAQQPDTRIFAVGDDWQSIYRFAGSDIHLMRNFGHEFGGTFAGSNEVHSTVDLGRTFRSVDKIAHAACSFVLKNPTQIQKQVIPVGATDVPAIKVVYYKSGQELASLKTALDEIDRIEIGTGQSSVLLLGRYRFVRPDNLDELESSHARLSVRFFTVHSSKGLEADHVIILRAASGRTGFPSEIVDDSLLDIVLPEPERFDHAEERRLFYVALTRARQSVTILADRKRPSAFVRELINNDEYGVIELIEPGVATH